MQERWKEYVEELYDENSKPSPDDIYLNNKVNVIKHEPAFYTECKPALLLHKKARWNTR